MAEVCGKLLSSWPFGEYYLKSITRDKRYISCFFHLSLDFCWQTLDFTLITRVPFIIVQIILAIFLSPFFPIPSYLNRLLSLVRLRSSKYAMYSRSTDIFTFWREFQTHCVCSLYTRTDPHAAKRAEPCSRWSKGTFDVRPVFDGDKFDSPEKGDKNANQKSRDYRRMQQILLSAHHEPSWTPSVLICTTELV